MVYQRPAFEPYLIGMVGDILNLLQFPTVRGIVTRKRERKCFDARQSRNINEHFDARHCRNIDTRKSFASGEHRNQISLSYQYPRD